MDRAAEAMRNGDVEQLQRNANEAQRQLQGAGDQLSEDQQLQRRRDFDRMAGEAEQLYQDQSAMEQKLLDGIDEAVANMDPETEFITSPFSYTEELGMADEKRDMIQRLQRLKEQMQNNATLVRSEEPAISRALESADQSLNETDVSTRLDLAASYMSRGESLYVANSEGVVTNALRSLRDSTEQALKLLSSDNTEQSNLETALDNLRSGRSELQNIAQQAQAGNGANTDEPLRASESNTFDPDALSSEQQVPEGTGSNDTSGAPRTNWGGWTGSQGLSEQERDQLNQQLNQALDSTGNLVPGLRARGVDEQSVREIQQLVRQLQNRGFSGFQDPSFVELNDTLSLLEELEARVETSLIDNDQKVRTQSPEIIPAEFREAVADYYRRLSSDKDNEVR